jgi:hypothetical protein
VPKPWPGAAVIAPVLGGGDVGPHAAARVEGEVRQAGEAGAALRRQRRLRVVGEEVVALGHPAREGVRGVGFRPDAAVQSVHAALEVEEVELGRRHGGAAYSSGRPAPQVASAA